MAEEPTTAFLFHMFNPQGCKQKESMKKKNYEFIKLPSVSEASKSVMYHFEPKKNQLFLLQNYFYNPKIESILHEQEKINKNFVSLFLNHYMIENTSSYACYPIDALYIFVSIIYYNVDANQYMTLEDYLNILYKADRTEGTDVIHNTLQIFKKNVNKVKQRIKLICDERNEQGNLFYKPNIKKLKNFYYFKCIQLFNYIIENEIVFSDFAFPVDLELYKKYRNEDSIKLFNAIKKKTKQFEKYRAYKLHMDKCIVYFNGTYYKVMDIQLRVFVWLIIKGFMNDSIETKIIPEEIKKQLMKMEEGNQQKKKEVLWNQPKNKKNSTETLKNQMCIDSFFGKKR